MAIVDKIENAPRWFLIIVLMVLWTAVDKGSAYIFKDVTGNAEANSLQIEAVRRETNESIASIKPILYTAKNNAEKALDMGNDLKIQIADVRGAQETFRKEYREDQKDLDRKLSVLLEAIKK